jgi:hypothetical protein
MIDDIDKRLIRAQREIDIAEAMLLDPKINKNAKKDIKAKIKKIKLRIKQIKRMQKK